MLNKKALLFVGAGLETLPGMRLAAEMGLRVVASDANINAPGMSIANDQILASTYDIKGTVAAAFKFHTETWPLSGVLCLGTDVPMTVAAVADTLGLPGISIRSALLAADKLAMKDCFVAHGVPIPWYASIESAIELLDIFSSRAETMVIKPVDSRGARGVLKLSTGVDLDWAYAYARENSPTGRVMVETYLDGPQVSTESLVIDGVCHTPGFSDRNYEYLERFAPNIIENGGELPTCLDANCQRAIRLLVDAGARAMGVCNGVIKGDIVLHKGRPYIIELATRLSGGYFCPHEIPLNTGVDFVREAIRQSLGESVAVIDLVPKFQRGVAQRYMFPSPGKVIAIDVPDWIAHDPDIALFEIRVSKGDTVQPAFNHPARAGVVITTGADRLSAMSKANAVVEAVRITTQ